MRGGGGEQNALNAKCTELNAVDLKSISFTYLDNQPVATCDGTDSHVVKGLHRLDVVSAETRDGSEGRTRRAY